MKDHKNMKIIKIIILLLITIILYMMNETRIDLIIYMLFIIMLWVMLEPNSNLVLKGKSELSDQAAKLADEKKGRNSCK